ncbi:MAG: hypothetical protein U5L04_01890 [Trueperaceae bacterium]|nr:hypothetical protein [Trueperaceae bacterium]
MNLLPRFTFLLSTLTLNLLSRSLHCHVGKPHGWHLPPGWG